MVALVAQVAPAPCIGGAQLDPGSMAPGTVHSPKVTNFWCHVVASLLAIDMGARVLLRRLGAPGACGEP